MYENTAWKAVVEKGSTRLAITRGLVGPKWLGNPKSAKGNTAKIL